MLDKKNLDLRYSHLLLLRPLFPSKIVSGKDYYRYFAVFSFDLAILLSENFSSHDSRGRWKIIASN
jgi:hypothetical protein